MDFNADGVEASETYAHRCQYNVINLPRPPKEMNDMNNNEKNWKNENERHQSSSINSKHIININLLIFYSRDRFGDMSDTTHMTTHHQPTVMRTYFTIFVVIWSENRLNST